MIPSSRYPSPCTPAHVVTGSIGNSMAELAVEVAKLCAAGDDDRVSLSRRAP